jgi:ethanolamine ammonia-lyase small subunit
VAEADPWGPLRQATRARIGLGRAGDALPTRALLEFQLAHARARDAVHAPLDLDALDQALRPRPILRLHSAAQDRIAYLRRPDLGRRLDAQSRDRLMALANGPAPDVVFVIADGLSAQAVMRHAAAVLSACLQRLPELIHAPVVVAEQARVAIGDEVGDILGAKLCLVLIGERPGLSVADSLGLYLTWAPRPGVQDSARNCISNIHADGLTPEQAAGQAAWLIREATRRHLTGVALKAPSPDDLLEDRSPPASLTLDNVSEDGAP